MNSILSFSINIYPLFALKRNVLNCFQNILVNIIAKVRLNVYLLTFVVAIYSSLPWLHNFEKTHRSNQRRVKR